jgi:hypothetical protein
MARATLSSVSRWSLLTGRCRIGLYRRLAQWHQGIRPAGDLKHSTHQFQQRTLTCIAGPRIGQVIFDPRLHVVRPQPQQQRVGGYDERGTVFE